MKFISVTISNEPINISLYINADHILSMLEKNDKTMIVFIDGSTLLVEEHIDDLLEDIRR